MIAIIDYDAGNLKSVQKALDFLHQECVITRDFHEIRQADKVILPGVGSFGEAMAQLKKYELDKVIQEVAEEKKPFLGICLGLQLLFEGSEESSGVEGLHLLDGQILRIPDTEQSGGFRISRDSRSRISDGIHWIYGIMEGSLQDCRSIHMFILFILII
jgi:glutamine amidotransferase